MLTSRLKVKIVNKSQRLSTGNVTILKIDNRSNHFNIKTNSTLLKLVNENLHVIRV